MDNIEKALRDETKHVRITHAYRWLVWSNEQNVYIVYEKRPYSRNVTDVIQTDSFEIALYFLLEDKA